jgi:hypothetical protein
MGSKPQLGDIVLFRPHKEDTRFKNVGHRPVLPAVIVKVWDDVSDLQVLPSTDLHVLQDAQTALTFVPFVKGGGEVGQWTPRT